MATVAAAAGRSRDAEAELNLPPGFRFHPTDEELVAHYLCRKVARQALPVPIIAEVDLYKFDPWDLPERALFGRKEWYFFTPRDRKYPNGSRPNRAAGLGYWKATGADKPVGSRGGGGRAVGIKKALVFYSGKAPRGAKTDWIMHEYRLADTNGAPATKKGGHKLDEWVLCRLYNKKNNWDKEKEKEKAKTEAERREAVAAPKDAVADTMSDSLQTHDSEMDTVWGLRDSGDMTAQGPMSNGGIMMKEDNDWFMDLNLDDLQASCMVLPPTVSPAAGQDCCYLPSPFGSAQAKMWQANFPPF